jgi:hypothetical protein
MYKTNKIKHPFALSIALFFFGSSSLIAEDLTRNPNLEQHPGDKKSRSGHKKIKSKSS